jgi:hypothetical protein
MCSSLLPYTCSRRFCSIQKYREKQSEFYGIAGYPLIGFMSYIPKGLAASREGPSLRIKDNEFLIEYYDVLIDGTAAGVLVSFGPMNSWFSRVCAQVMRRKIGSPCCPLSRRCCGRSLPSTPTSPEPCFEVMERGSFGTRTLRQRFNTSICLSQYLCIHSRRPAQVNPFWMGTSAGLVSFLRVHLFCKSCNLS